MARSYKQLYGEIADLQRQFQTAAEDLHRALGGQAKLESQLQQAQKERDRLKWKVENWEPWLASLGRFMYEQKILRFPDDVLAWKTERDAAIEKERYATNVGLRMLRGYCEALTRAEAAERERDGWRGNCDALMQDVERQRAKIAAVKRDTTEQRALAERRDRGMWLIVQIFLNTIWHGEPPNIWFSEAHRGRLGAPAEAQEEGDE